MKKSKTDKMRTALDHRNLMSEEGLEDESASKGGEDQEFSRGMELKGLCLKEGILLQINGQTTHGSKDPSIE